MRFICVFFVSPNLRPDLGVDRGGGSIQPELRRETWRRGQHGGPQVGGVTGPAFAQCGRVKPFAPPALGGVAAPRYVGAAGRVHPIAAICFVRQDAFTSQRGYARRRNVEIPAQFLLRSPVHRSQIPSRGPS